MVNVLIGLFVDFLSCYYYDIAELRDGEVLPEHLYNTDMK